MVVVRIPVTGANVRLRPPVGAEEMLLLEAGALNLRLALALLERLVQTPDGAPLDAAALPISDVDALLLNLLQLVVGDAVRADALCPASGCQSRVDVSFSIRDYFEHHAPDLPPDVVPADEPGWYRLRDADVEVRVPCAADQLAIELDPRPEDTLLARCVRPSELTEQTRQQVEAALETIAPSLCAKLEGTCSECGTTVELLFDPVQYTLRQLRDRAAYVYEDVARIAHHYHWSEANILALPSVRREQYAELVPRERTK